MRTNHKWTDWERDIIRRYYSHTRKSRRFLASILGVTEYGVAGQISQMGIGKVTDRRPWTVKEDEQLDRLMGKYNPRKVAKLMHRSINSVVVRSKRLEISRRHRDGWYTKREVCEILARDHKWVQARIDRGALVASYHYDSRPSQIGGSSWHIKAEDLADFIRKYPQDLIGGNIDIIQIVFLLSDVPDLKKVKGRRRGRPKKYKIKGMVSESTQKPRGGEKLER